MQSNDTTFVTRYVDGAWDVIRVSDGAVMQTYDLPRQAAEHAARLSTRAAIEQAAERDEAAGIAEGRAWAEAEAAVITARAEFARAERAYDTAGDDYERLWARDWVAEALETLEEAERVLMSLEAAPCAALSPVTLEMAKKAVA